MTLHASEAQSRDTESKQRDEDLLRRLDDIFNRVGMQDRQHFLNQKPPGG